MIRSSLRFAAAATLVGMSGRDVGVSPSALVISVDRCRRRLTIPGSQSVHALITPTMWFKNRAPVTVARKFR